MHESFWHYTDAHGAEHGPVTADAVRAAIGNGMIGPSSQFWREGLPGWVDLATAAAELGVGAATAPANPYAAPQAAVAAPAHFVAGGDVVPAGFVRRWAALFIDQLVLSIPLFVIAMVLGVALGAAGAAGSEPSPFFVLFFYLFYFVAAALYYSVQESSVHQASLGKRAVGIKVADRDGRRLSFNHALGRWFAASVSYMTFYIGFLMAAFTAKKTALHDLLSGTQVIDRWAYTEAPEKQQRELSGCLIAALVVLVLGPIAGVAIIAAVAISQYQDYARRAGGAAVVVPAPAIAQVERSEVVADFLARANLTLDPPRRDDA